MRKGFKTPDRVDSPVWRRDLASDQNKKHVRHMLTETYGKILPKNKIASDTRTVISVLLKEAAFAKMTVHGIDAAILAWYA